jgi:hypothetical protein
VKTQGILSSSDKISSISRKLIQQSCLPVVLCV